MNWRLGAVLVGCLALTACGPPVNGTVIAGMDENGDLVAVIGFCETGRRVDLSIGGSALPYEHTFSARHGQSDKVMRVVLRPGEVPQGWESADTLVLPKDGLLFISAGVAGEKGWGKGASRVLGAEIDMSILPPLPKAPELKAMANC